MRNEPERQVRTCNYKLGYVVESYPEWDEPKKMFIQKQPSKQLNSRKIRVNRNLSR